MALSTSGSSALTECKEALASTKLASTWILALHSCPGNVLTKKADTKTFVSVRVEPLVYTVGLDRATSPAPGRAPVRAAVDCPITPSGAAPPIVDGFRRVRRGTFTAGAIMEIQSALASARGRNGERPVDTCKPGRAGAHRPSEALHPTRSTDRAVADRAGARPYRATCCENASK